MLEEANPYQTPKSTTKSPSSGDSIIRVTRTTSYADRLRAYRIIVDGVERGRLSAGESIEIPVTASQHSVVAKVDWCGSPTVTLDMKSSSTVTLECESNLRGMRIFFAFAYILFFRNQYLTLVQV